MLKLTVAVLAIALASSASAAGWRDLRVDGSSEEAFAKSLEAFKDKLSSKRRYVFGEALKDIWIQGEKAAEAEQREYTAEAYYAELDGLGYDEVVTYTDPTGRKANQYREQYAYYASRVVAPSGPPVSSPWPDRLPPIVNEQQCRGCRRSIEPAQ
jgi:opacity protein-like surface antigen